jgi:integrase/recombinase XerD
MATRRRPKSPSSIPSSPKPRLFTARRADIECFARDLEARGRARATVARRLCTVAGFYRYAEQEGLLERSPAAHVRRPRLDYESHATGLDRNEVGALLVAAGLSSASEHALVSLLAINGPVSEALGTDIEALGLKRGHRTPTVLRTGGKVVTIPLAPRTARAIDLAIGERVEGPIFLSRDGQRLDRHAAWRIVRRLARKAGINKPVGPHTLRHASSPPPSTPASRSETSKRPHRTPIRAPPCATTGHRCRSTDTPPTSSPPSSPAPPGSRRRI